MEEQLPWIGKLKIVGVVEWQEDSGLEDRSSLVFEVLLMRAEHIRQILHDHGDIHESLVLGFGVHH